MSLKPNIYMDAPKQFNSLHQAIKKGTFSEIKNFILMTDSPVSSLIIKKTI